MRATGLVSHVADREQVERCVERALTGSLMRSTFETGALPHRWQTSQRLIATSYAIRNFAVTSSGSPRIGHLPRSAQVGLRLDDVLRRLSLP